MSHYSEFKDYFGGEERKFALPWAKASEFEEERGSLVAALRKLANGEWQIGPVRTAIRLGLVGGGMLAGDAQRLVARYVEDQPLIETAPLAVRILDAFVHGHVEEPTTDGE